MKVFKSIDKIGCFFALLLILTISVKGQTDSTRKFYFFGFSYGVQLPGADLANRFGINMNAGINFSYKTKSNWQFGFHGCYIFGDKIKEKGILDSLKTSQGFIINKEGRESDIRLQERGFCTFLTVGKTYRWKQPNTNSGFHTSLGIGYLQHKIRIYNVGEPAPQINGDYVKGYDRLTSGVALQEFIGYSYFGHKKMLNFFVGLELIQAFTQSRRSYDFDLMRADTQKRIDLLYGIRLGWSLPLYGKNRDFYYN